MKSLRLAFGFPFLVLLLPVAGCVMPAAQAPGIGNVGNTQQSLTPGLRVPATLDPKYTPDALKYAFSAACQKAGFRIRELAVDKSEFPFLLYGVMEGERSLAPVHAAVSAMKDYRYAGSATKRRDGLTIFAIDITPGDRNPATFARLRSLVGFPPQ